jgi:hypothetical protein
VLERRFRQRSEQYFTSSQQSCHFLRQVKGRWHTGQTFVGKLDLETPLGIDLKNREDRLNQVDLSSTIFLLDNAQLCSGGSAHARVVKNIKVDNTRYSIAIPHL